MHIYLASPLGFSPELASYRAKITAQLESCGHTVCDPWKEAETFAGEISQIHTSATVSVQTSRSLSVAARIGRMNIDCINAADTVLAVLDGTDCDSGTVGELCFAAGLGKPVYGLRTDFRNVGELPGLPINLQVLAFIEMSGGKLFRSIDDLKYLHKSTKS